MAHYAQKKCLYIYIDDWTKDYMFVPELLEIFEILPVLTLLLLFVLGTSQAKDGLCFLSKHRWYFYYYAECTFLR